MIPSLNRSVLLLICLFFCFAYGLYSQEVITGLYTNTSIQNTTKQLVSKSSKSQMLTLPFIDDFSGKGIFPEDSLWANKNVFINSSYPYLPVTIGVATFDALNDTGALYPDASSYGFIADSLTSKPFRLDSVFGANPGPLTIGDSIYFSFYYQPQGVGNAPEAEDSLVLEFYSPLSGEWKHIWASPGFTLAQFHSQYNVWFRQVMIPITDSANYFHEGFRFRFYNYVTLANNSQPSWAGNVDLWNIDYVYLDKDRNIADSVYKDIAFVEPATSLLKNYYAMPWEQFLANPSAEMKDSLNITISNLYSDTLNSSYHYNIYDDSGSSIHFYNGGSYNILPYYPNGYQTYNPHAQPPVSFSFPSTAEDSAYFRIEHAIKEGILGDSRRSNDTINYEQKFYNYYAYDDGVPEAGYGLTPANSLLGYRFNLNIADTLRAVKMFFNRTLNNASQQYFYLTIWDNASGKPNNIIYQKSDCKPYYEDSLNKFYNYFIDDTTLVLNGTFYIGWKQTTADNLNLGFDRSVDRHDDIFYNTGNGWYNSSYAGALMIRPVFGKELPVVAGIDESNYSNTDIEVYPNPCSQSRISLVLPDKAGRSNSGTIQIFDVNGKLLYHTFYAEQIDVSMLSNGVFILAYKPSGAEQAYYTRIIIIK